MTGENLRQRHFRTAYLEFLLYVQPIDIPQIAVENTTGCRYVEYVQPASRTNGNNQATANERTDLEQQIRKTIFAVAS